MNSRPIPSSERLSDLAHDASQILYAVDKPRVRAARELMAHGLADELQAVARDVALEINLWVNTDPPFVNVPPTRVNGNE